MTPIVSATDAPSGVPPWLTLLLATACGLIAANVYYAQPLVLEISQAIGIAPGAAGLIVTMTQIGYGAGLLLVVPMGDLFENRRLVLSVMAVGAMALAAAAMATHVLPFLLAALAIGLGSVSVQVLVPYAAHLSTDAMRGRAVGKVMSGLLLGIMLARPVSSLIAAAFSWHAVFAMSATVMLLLGAVLRFALPQRVPAPGIGYGRLLVSMVDLLLHTPVLQRRALYHAALFASFGLFWTVAPLQLAQSFHLSQTGIAIFALVGVVGVVSAPLAGSMADRGWTRAATAAALLAGALSFLLSRLGAPGSIPGLASMVGAAMLLDFGVSANLVLGQRAIFTLGAAHRSRLNGLYMATFFAGGAIGSAVGGWSYARGGWALASWVGFAMPVLAFLYWMTERPTATIPADADACTTGQV